MNKIFMCILGLFWLCSCSQGNVVVASSSSGGVSNSSSLLQISNISTIPTANSIDGEYVYLRLSNYLNNNLTLTNTTIQANGKELPNSDTHLFVDLTSCLSLAKRSTCNFKVFTNDKYQSYLLTLTFNDNKGNTLITKQVISFNNLLPNQNGFVYDANALNSNNSGLVVPFRLTNDYSDIKVLINNQPAKFSCANNSYKANTLCSANVGSLWLSGNDNQLKISGYDPNSKTIANTILTLTNSTVGNLVTSGANVVVNPDDGTNPQTVYLLNNGNNTVSNLTITPINPIALTSSTCGSSLAANASCSFVINVSGSITSGQSSVAVSYSNGQNSKVAFFNVSYISPNTAASLTLTSSGSFNNIIQNTGIAFISVNVYNSGSVNLTNMQFSNLNLQESSMSSFAANSTCSNGGSLAVGQSCLINLSYFATSVESGTVNFIPLANYAGSNGQTLTYANSILNIAYSTIASPTFIAAGDLGTVFSSSNYLPSTWTTTVASPFTSTTESANGIVINGSTYAMTLSSGRVVYSNNYGLFWQNAASTNLSRSQCGIIYDGTNYYTCGVESTTSGVCTAATGCIIYTNNFTTWNIATGGSTIAGTDVSAIAYFSDILGNKAYVAGPVRGSYSSNMVTTSTTGTSGWATWGSGNGAAVIGAPEVFVFNPNSTYITYWLPSGATSSSLITSISSSWNCCSNNTVTPESAASGAVFASGLGLYYVVNSLGKIYSTGEPKGPLPLNYSILYTGATRLNAIGYGNTGSNEVIAVGNSGAIVRKIGSTGFVAQASLIIGESTNPNLYSVYFESVNSNFWVTGVNAVAYTPVATTPSWTIPALTNITKYVSGSTNTYLAIDNQGHIFSSTNLTSWSVLSNPSNQILNDIACSEFKTCIAVGQNGTILKSVDGSTWTQISSPTTANLTSVTCQFGVCAAVGGTGAANSGIVLLSTNTFTNWVIASSSIATTQLNAIASFGNLLVAVGNNGTIFVSPNGYTWQSQTSGTANNLNSVSCSLSISACVAVGNSGTIVYSTALNLTSWSSATSNTTNDLTSVTNNGAFVASGKAGTIRYSTTGRGSWNTGTFPAVATTNLWGVISQ